MTPMNRASDYASHLSAAQGGEAYSETVRFNNNDYTITMQDPQLNILNDELLELLSIYVMRFNEAVAFEFTEFTGLPSHSTLIDITALKLSDADTYFDEFQCAARLTHEEGVVLLCIPEALRLTLTRKLAGMKAPFYERTIEAKGITPSFDYPDTPPTFFDNAMLTPYYATMLQMVTLTFDDVLPGTPLPLSLSQAKQHLNRTPGSHHFRVRYSLMCDENYRFKNGTEIISHGANIELFIDGSIIEKLRHATHSNDRLETSNKGIDIYRMLTLYPRTPLQETVANTSPYVLLLLLLIFDDETTTRLVSKLESTPSLRLALKILSKNIDEDDFVTFDLSALDAHLISMLEEAMRLYGLEPKRLEMIPYDQTVRVANIALKMKHTHFK